MTINGFLSVSPVIDGSMAEDVAQAIEALESFDIQYETTPMGTIIETDDIEEFFDAIEAAHNAVDADRVSTFVKIDHKRSSTSPASEKVAAVESVLGRPARNQSES